jgi:Ca-activated chloride channel family protein
MNLLVPAALAFAIIIPIILLFYFMRPKRQERVIGSTLLWQQALQDLQASRPWQRLRVTPLLLLQLLAAAIIVFILTRPAILTSSSVTGDTIIILQASASMQATDVKPSRFEDAKNQIADFIDMLGPNDTLSLIAMARTPQVLIANARDKSQLNAALQRATVTNQDADLEQALSLAASLAAGHSNAQVLVIGDGHVLPPDQQLQLSFPVHYLSIGTNAPNAALLALAARTLQGKLVALAQVANYSPQQRAIPVALYADTTLVGVQTILLPSGANGAVQWGPLNPNTRFLHAKLLSQDAMTVDHDAWAIVGGSLHGRVLLVTKGNSFLEAALRLQPNVNLYETTPDHYTTIGSYDLTIFDGFVPPTLPPGGLFFINPPVGTYPFGTVGPDIHVSSVNVGADTPNLLSNVDLTSIHSLRASHQLTPALWAQAVMIAPETPLLIAGENNNRRVAALGFDLHDTDLPLQPSFPVLIYNLVNWFMPSPVSGDGQVAAGVPITLQTWPGAAKVTVTQPDQHTTIVGPPFPVQPFEATNEVGIYQVTQEVNGQERYGAFAVNLFDPLQSRLEPATALPVLQSTNVTSSRTNIPRELREIWPWIAAVLLLVLCLEWWLFGSGYKKNETRMPQKSGEHTGSTTTITHSHIPATPFARLQTELEGQYRLANRELRKATKRIRKYIRSFAKRRQGTRGNHYGDM